VTTSHYHGNYFHQSWTLFRKEKREERKCVFINEKWASLIWTHFQVVLPLILEDRKELNRKLLDAAKKKVKIIKKQFRKLKGRD
jgi:hypothetical protein